ncbi:ABC transporter permease [Alkalibacterium olivapovliticus]|uniref:Osmoprotectant transport system permease protein n=1 Tax=Alkalibacterium olivapovliticus TaxID=99907 RepID=A0A2T0WBE7_9LACT|nr:ABC transporter permease [Alkalibacterium olivapovliticus]PRY83854.1 osmoprotectant transport system permease protein [Alkalibacterium olivapovliticus]
MLNLEGLDELTQMNTLQQLIYYVQENGSYLWEQFSRHFLISIYGVLFAAIVAIPIGFYIARHSKLADWVVGAANVIQTIPSLAMLSILMLGFGIGVTTVIITVFLYSLLPIVKNTYAGVKNVDNALMDAAKGMGMTRWQQTYKVELPMSISVIMAGLRNALVVAIGVTAIGTFIGAGGLGDIIQRGVNASQGGAIILAGAIPTALMAVAADLVLGWLEKKLDPSSRIRT